MTGPDYDEDGPDNFRPAPHPDDRLWRHPSEIAAMHAAHANAETAQVPVVQIDDGRSRFQTGLIVAVGVVAVGAVAVTLGFMSTSGGTSSDVATSSQVYSETEPIMADVDQTVALFDGDTIDSEELVAIRVHAEVATSLPRIQAATPSGMREGSGFFVTEDGHIATSAGLINDADYVLAWTDDGQRWKAHIVASDPVSDVAVIQIDSGEWPSLSLAANGTVETGHYALTLDHDRSVIEVGEVLGLDGPVLQIDQSAAVPGSAVIDDNGAVIAMVTNDGTNRHATPAWMLEQVAVDLISSGVTTHTWLGVIVTESPNGTMAVVSEVVADSPAADAGLRSGDLIDSVNGNPVADAGSLHRQIQQLQPGDDAVLTVTRNSSRRIIIATLTALPQ